MFNPVGQAAGMLGGLANPVFFGGVQSNRQPTRRPPGAPTEATPNFHRQRFMSAPAYRTPLDLMPAERAFV